VQRVSEASLSTKERGHGGRSRDDVIATCVRTRVVSMDED